MPIDWLKKQVYLDCQVCGTNFLHKWPHTFAGQFSPRMSATKSTTNLCELHFRKLIETTCQDTISQGYRSPNQILPIGSIPFEMILSFIDVQKRTEFTKKIPLIYNDAVNRIKLPVLSKSQEIKVTQMSINGFVVNEFHELISIDGNGSVYLEIGNNRDRFTFHPLNFSKNKKTFILRNGTQYTHKKHPKDRWKKFDFKEFVQHDHYEYIALGCSVTYGVGIPEEEAWPSRLKKGGTNVLNLGVPGGGIDQIFLNVIELLRTKIQFSKIVILLPNIYRHLMRTNKYGYYFNNLVLPNVVSTENEIEHIGDGFNIYFTSAEQDIILKKGLRKLVLGKALKRNEKIIKRMMTLLGKKSIDFKISSWDDETYGILESCVPEYNLLPKFNEDKDLSLGFDEDHPAGKVHEKWINIIKNRLEGASN